MAALTCAEARDLASDLLDGELTADLARQVEEHVAGCPTCPNLYRALVAVYRELTKLKQASEAAESGGSG
jgi:RNA polymerase sigma-70 factor, ECF subfamily